MAVFSDCPPEILAQIARLTGWSLSFRLTCKEVSRCFTGPLYKYDTVVGYFHHECKQLRSLLNTTNDTTTNDTTANDTQTSTASSGPPASSSLDVTLPSDHLGEVRPGIPNYAEVEGTQINTSLFKYVYTIYPQHREECEAIAALQLYYRDPMYRQIIEHVILYIGNNQYVLNKDGLLKDTLPYPEEPCIPIFPTRMPLLLGYMKKAACTFAVEVYARHARGDFFIFPIDILIFPAKLKCPWYKPVRVKYTVVHDMNNGYARHILGWAIHIPKGLAHDVTYLRFSLRPSPSSPHRPPLYVDVKWIRPHHFDFPIPLDTHDYVVIPPSSPRAEIHYRYQYPITLSFTTTTTTTPTAGNGPESLPEDAWTAVDWNCCYVLRQCIIDFPDGQCFNISLEHMGIHLYRFQ